MTSSAVPAAVLWDMDGTLIDSEPYWIEAEIQLADRCGVVWTYEDGLTLVGNPLDTSAEILQARGVELPASQIIDTLLSHVARRSRATMPWMDDARKLLMSVHTAGVPCALVTMSQGVFVDAFLEAAGDVFDAVVTGDQVRRGKPDPEAYLLAASRLGVKAHQCVAIEDSAAGAASAHAAGARTIAVKRHVEVPALPGLARVASLDGITLDALRSFARGELLVSDQGSAIS